MKMKVDIYPQALISSILGDSDKVPKILDGLVEFMGDDYIICVKEDKDGRYLDFAKK